VRRRRQRGEGDERRDERKSAGEHVRSLRRTNGACT